MNTEDKVIRETISYLAGTGKTFELTTLCLYHNRLKRVPDEAYDFIRWQKPAGDFVVHTAVRMDRWIGYKFVESVFDIGSPGGFWNTFQLPDWAELIDARSFRLK